MAVGAITAELLPMELKPEACTHTLCMLRRLDSKHNVRSLAKFAVYCCFLNQGSALAENVVAANITTWCFCNNLVTYSFYIVFTLAAVL
jgi:hypothetical protein